MIGAMKTPSLSFLFRMAASVLGLGVASALLSQETPTPIPSKDSLVKMADRHFLTKAAKAGHEEIAISTVAMNRSSNLQVKEFAQQIVNEHQNLATQLLSLAATKRVELPAKDSTAAKWDKKSAKSFDKEYLKEMVDQHEDAVELFSKAAKSDDPEIAAFAGQQLPVLQSHLSKAKELLKTVQ